MNQISHTSEDDLILRLTQDIVTLPEVITGIGDDCAVIKKDEKHHTLLKTDTIVEHIHFTAEENPQRIGWKAAARVISDFAAMGGEPEALLVTIILPPNTPIDWVENLYNGIKAVAKKFHCSIVGGETSSTLLGSPKVISISGTGRVNPENLTLRSGGNPTDLIYVTSTLGGSIHGKHLDFTPRIPEALWLAQNFKPTAMMDISDGIAKDLPRLAAHSKCGFELFPSAIPKNPNCTLEQALTDGEDYELLFTISAENRQPLETHWASRFPILKLTNIGKLTAHPHDFLTGGWDHFTRTIK
jgi:thiamine-monophosphate kinase